MMHLYTFIQRNCVFMLAFFDTTDCRGLSEPNQARDVGTVLTQELYRAVCVCSGDSLRRKQLLYVFASCLFLLPQRKA